MMKVMENEISPLPPSDEKIVDRIAQGLARGEIGSKGRGTIRTIANGDMVYFWTKESFTAGMMITRIGMTPEEFAAFIARLENLIEQGAV